MGPGPRGRLYRRPARAEQPAATAILHGLACRTALNRRPAVGAAQAVGRHKKAPPGMAGSSGARVGMMVGVWPVLGHPRASTLKISHASGFCGRVGAYLALHLATGEAASVQGWEVACSAWRPLPWTITTGRAPVDVRRAPVLFRGR